MTPYEPEPELVFATRTWLGADGIAFFQECLDKYGKVNPVIPPDPKAKFPVPHPVHFREGMQVRNFLRGLPQTEGWDDHDYDNRWALVVQKALG
jgi:hypothetical protein